MKIGLTRINPDQHTLSVKHSDGSIVEQTLETKSFFTHDLVHFALEETAGLRNSFWGQLAQQQDPNRDNPMGRENFKPETEIEFTEVLTGPLMGLTRNPSEIHYVLNNINETFKAYGVPTPTFVTETFLNTFLTRFNELKDRWNATPFGKSLELEWKL
jgi:hypothetical protein